MGCNTSVIDQKCCQSSLYGQTDLNSVSDTIEHAEANLEKFISEAIVFGNRVEAVMKFLQSTSALQSFMSFLESEQSNSDLFKEIEHIVESDEDLEKAAIALVQKYNFPEVLIQFPSSSRSVLSISPSINYNTSCSFQYEMYEGEGTICCSDSDGSVRAPSQCHYFSNNCNINSHSNNHCMSNKDYKIIAKDDLHDCYNVTEEEKCDDIYCLHQHHHKNHNEDDSNKDDDMMLLDKDQLQHNIVSLLTHVKSFSHKENSNIITTTPSNDDEDVKEEVVMIPASVTLIEYSTCTDYNQSGNVSNHPLHTIACFSSIQGDVNNTIKKSSNNNSKKSSGMSSISMELKEMYKKAQREILFMIAMDSIPRYLESDDYKEWREEEVENNYSGAQLMLELEKREGLEYSYKDICGDLNSLHLDPQSNSTSSYIRRAFAALDPLEVPNIARSSFLSVFLGSVEGLPISVSLSTANPKRPGFPLIYVNAIFEKTTGYARKEIIGRNCRFLQAGRAEMDSIAKLNRALAGAKPVKVEITNYRKNGEPFRNLLAMKPIFDQNGKYAYVVGLQFDVSNEESASLPKLQYIDYLLSMLPDRLPFDDTINE